MKHTQGMQTPGWGYVYVATAALLWAVAGSAAKFLFNNGVSAHQVVQLRLTISAAGLLLWIGLYRRALLGITLSDLPYFAILGSLAMAAVQFTYLLAISKINVAAAILLQYLAPVLITLYALLFLRERLTWVVFTAVICATLGCYFVVGAYNLKLLSMNKVGIASGLLSAIAFAWYSLQGEYGMRRYHPWTILVYALLFAAITWNIIHPPLEAFTHDYSLAQWAWIGFIAIFGTIAPFGLYLGGINLIRSARASITATLEPITAGVLSFLFLGEIMTPLQIFGGMMVICAIILLQLKKEHDPNSPAALRAQRSK